jgi:hypothetical protein
MANPFFGVDYSVLVGVLVVAVEVKDYSFGCWPGFPVPVVVAWAPDYSLGDWVHWQGPVAVVVGEMGYSSDCWLYFQALLGVAAWVRHLAAWVRHLAADF